jgi:hypothetical protein
MTRLAGLLVILFFQYTSSAQPPDTADPSALHSNTPVNSSPSNPDDWLQIYNGRQFYAYALVSKGDAFYPRGQWYTGNIVFDGISYSGITMMYDAFKDEVVVKHPANLPIILFSERIREFSFDGNYFFYVKDDNPDELEKGFYQRLLAGKVTLLSKRTRLYTETVKELEIEREFLVTDKYYVLKDGKYYRINNKKQLLDVLGDKRKDLSDKRRELRLKFKRDPETFMKILTGYYNQLSS